MRSSAARYAAACGALVVLLAAIVFLNDLGHFNTDIKPEVYLAPWEMVGRYLSSWTASPYLGSANFNVGLVPVLLVLSALRGLGINPEWTFKIFHLALWLVAAWGANRLMRVAAPRASRWVGLAAAVFYLANPYAIASGNTLAIALPMAFLPSMLLCYVRALQRPRGWAWPAAFGLTFFAMSGMNVAVVPLLQLLGLLPIAVVARWHDHRSVRKIVEVTARCALFVFGVSSYWLVPSIAALGAGTRIVDTSETLDGIHKVSSFTEVLRGLGLWPLYGHSDSGPWVPQNAVYVTSPAVILLTALWPALALVSLGWARTGLRRVLVLTAGMAAVVMVGLFPGQNQAKSPFGWLLQAILSFPPLAAFRTTNKIGALLALAFAFALAGGAVLTARAVSSRAGFAPIAAALSVVVVAAWILPALAGGLYISRMDIPDYWKQAAAAADKGAPHAFTLLLPGQTRPTYRWTVQRPDDLTNSLLKRDAAIPETTPNASASGANLLAALDDTVQEGTAEGDIVSTFARYLGADNVLLRHDVVWENDGGARPAITSRLVGGDEGLYGVGNFGRPGQNVLSPTNPPITIGEAVLPPVQLYGVRDARKAVRAQSLQNQVIVAGDGWAFPEMASADLLRTSPTVRYAQDLTSDQLRAALIGGARLVLSDTNARRNTIPQRLTAGQGALLGVDEKLTNSRTLGTDSADQTVLLRSGALMTATSSGGTFFGMPYGMPENAFDGNPDTSWRFGDFRRAAGQRLSVQLPSTEKLDDITISQADLGPVKIDKVTMTAGGRSVTTSLPDTGHATFHMGGVRADKVTVSIDGIRGEGYNLVGVSELGLPGPNSSRVARTPQTLTRLYGSLGSADRAIFDKTPFDVLLTRVQNTPSAADDSEIALRRIVSMPDDRSYDATASVRLAGGSRERLYDRSAGFATTYSATSSGFWFDKQQYRASAAADGEDATGWIPVGATPEGQWWQLSGPKRAMNAITVSQRQGEGGDKNTVWATRASFYVDDRKVATSDLTKDGDTKVSLPDSLQGSRVRMVIEGTSGEKNAKPAEFTAIDTGVTMKKSAPGPFDEAGKHRCLKVATVDGAGVPMRLDADHIAGPGDQGTAWSSCAPVRLEAGDRRIEQADGFVLDSLQLKDRSAKPASVPVAPVFQVMKDSPTSKQLKITSAAATQSAVILGQSYDSRWHATLNGRDLGPATTIDGFSSGWLLPKNAQGMVEMSFAPQRYTTLAIVFSALFLVLSAIVVVRGARSGAMAFEPVHRSEAWAREQRRESRPVTGRLDRRGRSLITDVLFVLVATIGVGVVGFVAAVSVVALLRWRGISARRLVLAGAVIVLLAVGLFLLLDQSLGEVSADAIAASLWPHRLVGAGLVVALGGLLRADRAGPQRTNTRAGSHTVPPARSRKGRPS